MHRHPLILLVEDLLDDIVLIRRASNAQRLVMKCK